MRRAFTALAVVMVLVGLAASPASATVTITARTPSSSTHCGHAVQISGLVTPHTATPRVVLQKTYGGVWRDVKWYSGPYYIGEPKKLLVGPVNSISGAYKIDYYVLDYQTMHFRVRSNGGSVMSKSFYVSVPSNTFCG